MKKNTKTYFDNTVRKLVMEMQESIDKEKENIPNSLFVKMKELLLKIYDSC